MMRIWNQIGFAVLIASVGAGCTGKAPVSATVTAPRVFEAVRTPHSLAITGVLDELTCGHGPVYRMNGLPDAGGSRMPLEEGGSFRFAWDDQFLYLCVDFTDSDVVTKADQDGLHAYKLGDVCELFLQPVGQPCYWELYVTPNGHQTTFLWPSVHNHPPSALQKENHLIVAAHVDGTLNDSRDRDHNWTAQMAVPWSILKFEGQQFGPHTAWHALVGRYNYSIHLPATELSSAPAISARNFHLTSEYATLLLKDSNSGLGSSPGGK